MSVEVDDAYFGVRTWACTVRSTRNVSTLIREIVLSLPESEEMDFRAGGFVQITCPAFHLSFEDFDIAPAFRDVWDKGNLWSLEAAARRVLAVEWPHRVRQSHHRPFGPHDATQRPDLEQLRREPFKAVHEHVPDIGPDLHPRQQQHVEALVELAELIRRPDGVVLSQHHSVEASTRRLQGDVGRAYTAVA